MLLRFTTLALSAATVCAMSCMEAVQKVGGIDTNCRKQCSKEGGDGLRQCTDGEKERTPESCGGAECSAFLETLDDATIDDMMTALASCDGEMAGHARYGALGADWFKVHIILNMAEDCGHPDSFVATLPAAETCLGGFYRTLGRTERACPKRCDTEAGKDLPQCNASQEERSPETCGMEACGDAIAEIDDKTMEESLEGLASCAQNEQFKGYAVYATMQDGEYLKTVIRSWAEQCSHENRVALTPPPMDSCRGAVMVVSKFDRACPKQCEDPDSDSPVRACEDGENERAPSSCELPKCQNILAKTKAGMEDIKTGLGRCPEEIPEMAVYAQYVPQLEAFVMGMTSQCGFNYEDLKVPTTTTNTTHGGRCTSLSRQVYDKLHKAGWKPKPCT